MGVSVDTVYAEVPAENPTLVRLVDFSKVKI